MHAIKKGPVPIPEKQSTHIPIFNQPVVVAGGGGGVVVVVVVVVVVGLGVGVGGWRLVVCCLLFVVAIQLAT